MFFSVGHVGDSFMFVGGFMFTSSFLFNSYDLVGRKFLNNVASIVGISENGICGSNFRK